MTKSGKRVTVDCDENLQRALPAQAARRERSVSDLVDEEAREALSEDAEDLVAFDERAAEPSLPFEEFVRDLRRRREL